MSGAPGSAPTPPSPLPWWRDRRIWTLLAVTVLPRLAVAAIGYDVRCVRDECMYLFTAHRMMDGLGMTPSNGWLWAPGQVALMAIHGLVTGYPGTVKVTQCLLAGVSALLLVRLGTRVGGERAGFIAAWIYALSPTLVFFAARLWSEITYATLLLLALEALFRAREGGAARAILPGLALGACVLLRGVATYMLPIFALGLLWGRWRERRAWVGALLLVVATVATVGPYSAYASRKFGAFIVSDRTMGQMMWLGDNDFAPVTFDWGNGLLTDSAYAKHTGTGRLHCAEKREPIVRDTCETAAGIAWIREHPDLFLRRVPLRLAQMLNPNTFLTRALRDARPRGIVHVAADGVSVLVVAFSFLHVLGAAVGAWARGRGVYVLVGGLTTAYHLAAVGALAGLSRYRLPLEVLWLPFVGALLAAPRASWAALAGSRRRLVGAILTVALLLPLLLWFLPAGFPRWKYWSS